MQRKPPTGGFRAVALSRYAFAGRLAVSRVRPRQPQQRSASTQRYQHSSALSAPFQKVARLRESSGTPRRRSRGTNAASPPASAPAPAAAWVGMGRRNSPDLSIVVGRLTRPFDPATYPSFSAERATHTTRGAHARRAKPGAEWPALLQERTNRQLGGYFPRGQTLWGLRTDTARLEAARV
jgi:hypothetical protein